MIRRDLFRVVVVAATGVATAIGAAALPATSNAAKRDKRKPQYQPNSPEVQTFYRVNRYPAR